MTHIYKLSIIGDGGVGKTCFSKGSFEQKYIATLGVEVYPKYFSNIKSTFNIWDCAGQEKLRGLRDGYYVASDCAILMFDLTSHISFMNLTNWLRDLRKVCPNIPVLLCGNKSDIPNRKVSDGEIQNFCSVNNLQYLETSAKNRTNIDVAFLCLKAMM